MTTTSKLALDQSLRPVLELGCPDHSSPRGLSPALFSMFYMVEPKFGSLFLFCLTQSICREEPAACVSDWQVNRFLLADLGRAAPLLGNGTFLSLWLLCLHTFCYLMSTLANE